MRRLREGDSVEIKNEQIQMVQREIVAFLNTNGGTIYVGISNKGTVLGVKNIEEVIQTIWQSLKQAIKPNVMPYVQLEQSYLNQKPIIIINVQRGHARPYFLTMYGLTPKGVFIGSKSNPATQSIIDQMIKETDGESFETRRSLNQSLTFNELEKQFKAPFSKEQMQDLGLLNLDDLYTNLAFIVSDQCDYGISIARFEEDQLVQKQSFKGSILKQVTEVSLYLKSVLKEDYTEPILKEVLLNAMMHRSYLIRQDIFLNLYTHCLEVISIGGLLETITLSDVLQGFSIYRNPNLVQLFDQLHLIKAHGTGLRTILKAYQSYNKRPEFYVTTNVFKVILPNLAFCKEKELAYFAEYIQEEKDVLNCIQSKGPISRAEIEKQLGLKKSTVMRILKRFKQEQKIRCIGKGRGIKYSLIDE